MPDADEPSSSSSDSSSDGFGDDDTPPTQWLATTRQRRSTAGNRMKTMLAEEEPDSELELLFAEDDHDHDFEDALEDASDVHMDSSDDDDDNGDDLEGERELERRKKEALAASRKRKARDAIPAKFRKRVRIDPTAPAAPAAPAPRPKKKSERASWLPSPADLPTRSSARKTTRISKEHLHRQMVEREARRLKQLAMMQKKAAKLEALKKPPMSQADRLAEAAVVEKRNSKSLNRWEEAEKQREEERRARLAALNNRTLSGPVITFWSGVREWKDALGQHVTLVEAKPKKKRDKVEKGTKAKDEAKGQDPDGARSAAAPDAERAATAKDAGAAAPEPEAERDARPGEDALPADATAAPAPVHQSGNQSQQGPTEQPPAADRAPLGSTASQPSSGGAKQEEEAHPMAMTAPCLPRPPLPVPSGGGLAPPAPPSQGRAGPRRPPGAGPSSVLAAPVLAPPPGMDMDAPRRADAPKSGVLAPPDTSQHHAPPPPAPPPAVQPPSGAEPVSAPRPAPATVPTPAAEPEPRPASRHAKQSLPPPPSPRGEAPPNPGAPSAAAPEPPRGPTTTARNAIIFQSFDHNAIRDKTVQTQILFGRKMTKLSRPTLPAPCTITAHPARYRDPETNLPYHSVTAYREIRRLHAGHYRWSRLLGAWVGSPALAARGVPARFLCPDAGGPPAAAAGRDGCQGPSGPPPPPAKPAVVVEAAAETAQPTAAP